ncbi:MAG: ABC transporter substrate-binding protein [Paracoccaceae bacterium]
MPDDAFRPGRTPPRSTRPFRVGLLLPRSGPAALWRLGVEAGARLAADALTEDGGAGGRPVEILEADAGAAPESAVEAVRTLAAAGAEAVVGMQLSHQRNAVARALGGRAPYVFIPHYEGGWCGPGVTPLGLGDAETLGPALAWFAARAGVRRLFFVGNDYVWPRAAHGAAREAARGAGLAFAGAALLPVGFADPAPLMTRIAVARPDLVVTVLIGEDAVRFHRAFAAAGLPASAARLALGFDETLLWAVGARAAEGLFAVQPFVIGADPGPREALLARYAARFGDRRPPVAANTLACHDGVRLAAALARRALRGVSRAAALDLLGAPDGRRDRPPAILAEADGARFRPRLAC